VAVSFILWSCSHSGVGREMALSSKSNKLFIVEATRGKKTSSLDPKQEDKLRQELEAMPLWELSEWDLTELNLEKKRIIREIHRKRNPFFDEAIRDQEDGIIYNPFEKRLLERQIKKYTEKPI
jgi:hypothetical protein